MADRDDRITTYEWIYEDEEESQLHGYLRLAQKLALLFAGLIGLSAFWGLRQILAPEGGLSSWLIAGCLALVLAAVLAGAWHILLNVAVRRRLRGVVLALLIGGGLGLTAIQIATTSWFLATALGGQTAVQAHRTAMLNDLGDVLSDLLGRNERERALLSAMSQAGSALDSLLECERREGCVSGVSGNGPVARDLTRVRDSFEGQQRELEAALERRPALLAGVREQIERARQAALDGDGRAFGAAVNAALSGLSTAGSAEPLRMIGSVQDGSDLPQVQAILARLRATVGTYEEFGTRPALPAYAPMDRASAVIAYADDITFAWVIAVVADCLPAALLLLILLAAHLRQADPLCPPPAIPEPEEPKTEVRAGPEGGGTQEPRETVKPAAPGHREDQGPPLAAE